MSGGVFVEREDARRYVFTILHDDEVIGHAILYIKDPLIDGREAGYQYGDVQDVWVHIDHRGKGFGKRLMEAIRLKARRLGLKRITLTSNPLNPARAVARQMYLDMGYRVVTTTEVFVLELED